MDTSIWLWVGFGTFIFVMLCLDLGLLNRHAHTITYREATIWSTIWVSLALIFGAGVFWKMGNQRGLEFLTGYLIELSLSVDNLFVFLLIFSYFKVPSKFQHRVLFWGVMGALIMRMTMILVGTALIQRFHWIIYVFGSFLIFTGIKMFRESGETEIHPEQNPVVRLVTRFIPIARHYDEDKFFTNIAGRRTGTLLLLVLVIVEVTDLVFAVDSIPAILAITNDRFILYTSNVFAILGLRSLYFLLAGVVEKFHYLRLGLAIVLTFIGVKMLLPLFAATLAALLNLVGLTALASLAAKGTHIPIGISLSIVAIVLASSVIASLIWPKRAETHIEVELPPGFGAPFNDDEGKSAAETSQDSIEARAGGRLNAHEN